MSPVQRIKRWSLLKQAIVGGIVTVMASCMVLGIAYVARGSGQAFQNKDALCKVEESVSRVDAKAERNRDDITEIGKDIAEMRGDVRTMLRILQHKGRTDEP